MLDWTDGDVGDVFLRTFEISYDVYGQVRNIPLVDGGADILVTNENRHSEFFVGSSFLGLHRPTQLCCYF